MKRNNKFKFLTFVICVFISLVICILSIFCEIPKEETTEEQINVAEIQQEQVQEQDQVEEKVQEEQVQEQVEKEQPKEPELVSLGWFNSSAYDRCYDCCEKTPDNPYYGITATGTVATAGRTIAVDPNVIPYGTNVIINGHTYLAEDTGGAIKGKKIDIFFETHAESLQYGRRQVEVFIYQ